MTSLRGEGSAQPADLEEALSVTFTELLYKVTLPCCCGFFSRACAAWHVWVSCGGWSTQVEGGTPSFQMVDLAE